MQNCRACRSTHTERRFVISGNHVVSCRDCSHVFLDVTHTPDTIRQMYQDYEAPDRDFYFKSLEDSVIEHLDDYLRRCRQYCRNSGDRLRLLDIGCGMGTLLSRAVQQGFECSGVEICEGLARIAGNGSGITVYNDFLENLSLPKNSVDVVTMYDLIEHIPDPAREIEIASGILKPGGVLFVLTPNDNALMRRIARAGYRWTFHAFGFPMRRLYYHHHLSYFTESSLTCLARRSGLEIAAIETRNQEMSRLNLSPIEKLGTRIVFGIAERYRSLGGKLLLWARKV